LASRVRAGRRSCAVLVAVSACSRSCAAWACRSATWRRSPSSSVRSDSASSAFQFQTGDRCEAPADRAARSSSWVTCDEALRAMAGVLRRACADPSSTCGRGARSSSAVPRSRALRCRRACRPSSRGRCTARPPPSRPARCDPRPRRRAPSRQRVTRPHLHHPGTLPGRRRWRQGDSAFSDKVDLQLSEPGAETRAVREVQAGPGARLRRAIFTRPGSPPARATIAKIGAIGGDGGRRSRIRSRIGVPRSACRARRHARSRTR
jgi:hypothetical protein